MVLGGALLATAAHAARVESVSPQGEVPQVQQLTVRFSEAVVPFGDPRLADPFKVTCTAGAPTGSGRWVDDRVWRHDFATPLPPGVRCQVLPQPGWKPLAGTLEGRTRFEFHTGGPAVVGTQPWSGAEIAEDQHFLLTLSGPAHAASVATHAWCEVEGLGDRLPLRVIEGAPREALLKARRVPEDRAARTLVAHCARPLPAETAVRLVWGAGIGAALEPSVVTSAPQRFDFTVRRPFVAEFSCERERAQAPCLPIRPVRLRFSAPVARAQAEQARLVPNAGTPIAPQFDKDDRSEAVSQLSFASPLPENTAFRLELPSGLKDDAGRALANAGLFPLAVATGAAPPVAKFASAPFGIVEAGPEAVVPLTLRQVQADLRPAAASGQVRVKRVAADDPARGDAALLDWLSKLQRYHEREISAREAGLPEREWTVMEADQDARGRPIQRRVERRVATRELSLLARDTDARRLDLPVLDGGDPRPFEVVGIPIAQPGYHVLEIESARLGAALLDRPQPMFVRTGVLVTNLGVHFKHGRENSLVWVTTLDRGRPVEGAQVAVNDCRGQRLWSGRTDALGLAHIDEPLLQAERDCLTDDGFFVTARQPGAKPGDPVDTSFVFSAWQKGIESWRFDVPTSLDPVPDVVTHTVLDRTLLRAGETVSMKHFVRRETVTGLAALPRAALPTRALIVHRGSGDEISLPLGWNGTARSAQTSWTIPPAAKLGVYDLKLERDAQGELPARTWDSGDFRVEAFRLPLVEARLAGPKGLQVAPTSVPLDVQLGYFSGGGLARAPATVSALLVPRPLRFAGYEAYAFDLPRDARRDGVSGNDDDESEASDGLPPGGRLVADKQALTTDASGAAQVTLTELPVLPGPTELQAELSFTDPNGEVQTVATRVPLWPAAVVPGIKASAWVSNRGKVAFTALALDTQGRPLKGQALTVRGRASQVLSTRKRMVGGFYAYDNRTEARELGPLCEGRTDARGLLLCEAELTTAGQVELIVEAKDSAGRSAQAATTVWITRQGELWFAQDNDDRMDVLPEKRRYEPGETARLQVRMPFREATALVSVEREGVITTKVVTLRGDDPTIELKIEPTWGPNVFVSVLALRGRLRELSWRAVFGSFFDEGWRQPLAWARSVWGEGREYQAPTAMVDLSKPAYKLGMAALAVGSGRYALQVEVLPDKAQYLVRQKATARIKVTQGGRPVPEAEIAFAAVDEGLLALRDNDSWQLLEGMVRERAWGVETSTGQSEIVGRRHFGRKAVAAGGGGGRGATRELFDTLLLWRGRVPLDAKGEAVVDVPLNDSLTSFRFVAIADAVNAGGVPGFGTGSATIRVTQDLQVLSGLPPVVREGDRYQALLTLRNTTTRPMGVRVGLEGTVQSAGFESLAAPSAPGSAPSTATPTTALKLPPQTVLLAAGAAQTVTWTVNVPADARAIAWRARADEDRSGAPGASAPAAAAGERASDQVAVTQRVLPAVPMRVLQATMAQLDGRFVLPASVPADALPADAAQADGPRRGGLLVSLQPRLSDGLPGVRRYFEAYPYACLEQRTAKAIGLDDAALWGALVNELPTYLDADGLAAYFPPRPDEAARGSDRLTAHLLSAAQESGRALPDAVREAMLGGLLAFVEGRIERRFWAPRDDLAVRKLAAIAALARHGRAQPALLDSVALTPNLWPTAALIDWLVILQRMEALPQRDKRLDEVRQLLRSRLAYGGTTLTFSTEQSDFWWWLMDSGDANALRLLLAVIDDPAWKQELPRLAVGALGRQKQGAWLTTPANLWGTIAMARFSKAFETAPLTGTSIAQLGAGSPQSLDWATQPQGASLALPWRVASASATPPPALVVTQQGSGKPWVSVQSLAAVPLTAPLRAGYSLARRVSAVERKHPDHWSRGDIVRVRVEIEAQADMAWAVLSDPVPGGATVLGSGLGRDSALATRGEQGSEQGAQPAFEERSFEALRRYYEHLPRGRHVVEYTLRLNNAGRFALPPTRIEAMYAPETFGELPNEAIEVLP